MSVYSRDTRDAQGLGMTSQRARARLIERQGAADEPGADLPVGGWPDCHFCDCAGCGRDRC